MSYSPVSLASLVQQDIWTETQSIIRALFTQVYPVCDHYREIFSCNEIVSKAAKSNMEGMLYCNNETFLCLDGTQSIILRLSRAGTFLAQV